MRRFITITFLLLFVTVLAANEDDVRILMEANIEQDEGAVVRSGPGIRYYATSRLQKGDRVKVIRKDTDGWMMIVPPNGSYSWVSFADFGLTADRDREYIHANGTSQVTSNRVDVRVGSHLDPEAISTVSTHLSKGDTVRIIGTRRFEFDTGPQEMMKIHPVKGEYRWIHSDSMTPGNRSRSEPSSDTIPEKALNLDLDQATNGEIVRPRRKTRHFDEDSSIAMVVQEGAIDSRSDNSTSRRTETLLPPGRRRLKSIDRDFQIMIRQDPITWDIRAIEKQYLRLNEEIAEPSMTLLIGLRLDAINRYRAYYNKYLDFERLTLETRQRDAELATRQSPSLTRLQPMADPLSVNSTTGIQAVTPWASTGPTTSKVPAFDGAGIVRRVPEGATRGPRFALVAPDGQTLAFLQPTPGIDLNRYEGRAMGITGLRYFRSDWKGDTIAVQNLQEVRLK